MYHDSLPIFVKEYYFNSNIILALKIIKSSIPNHSKIFISQLLTENK